jgi:type I restriction enzyme S subunit
LRSSAVRPGKIDFDDRNFLPADVARTEHLLSDGDLLVTRLSGSLEYVGNCAVVRNLGSEKLYFPDRIFCAKLTDDIYAPYLEYAFQVRLLRHDLEAAAKSSAGHQRISLSDLRRFVFPLPSFEEQQEISKQIERMIVTLEQIEECVQESLAKLRELDHAMLAKAFRGELVPQEPTDEPASVLLERICAETSSAGIARPRRGRRSART